MSFAPYSSAKSQANDIAKEKAGIVEPDYFGNYTRQKQYYSVGGLTKGDKYRYIIINAKSGKTEVINKNNAPVRQTVIAGTAQRYNAKKILHINLGVYKDKPTWEVAFQKKNGSIGYNLVDFRTGKSIQIINNI
ncbi:extracellular protein precursor [Companilactobacillus kimchiensis]|uniref:Extracellular protein n=2 Tax=Companilactobacillus kimchiensis TaxID=993692 RepID=A0A0R2LF93_9LACO|nr:extracellular protein precursor [Companilactobacillus kimchiensis]